MQNASVIADHVQVAKNVFWCDRTSQPVVAEPWFTNDSNGKAQAMIVCTSCYPPREREER